MATASGNRVLASDTTTVAEAMASPVISGAAARDPATSTGSTAGAPPSPPHMAAAATSMGTDDNAVEKPEVIMGHPGLRALGIVSLRGDGHDPFCAEPGAPCAPLGEGGHQ
jgi:hypothetical protein